MTLEFKLKRVALNAAVDLALKSMKKSPERCARNLMELGISAFPNSLSEEEKTALHGVMVRLCECSDASEIKKQFFMCFQHPDFL